MTLVGLRVLRGPDWNHGDIDGGHGHVGTIVNIGGLNTAQVLWDNGQQCVCKIGENGHHDLKIFDTGPVGVRHIKHYVCSSCSERAIFGMRWQCKQCSDVNLCPVCYVTDKHDINHPFLRFDTPQSHGVEIPKRSASVKCQAMGIFPGATVKRGRDWKWGSQDGGDGKTGEVVSITNNEEFSSVRNVVNVKWSSTGLTHNYRLGGIGKVDLMFVEQSRGPFNYRDHLPDCGTAQTMTLVGLRVLRGPDWNHGDIDGGHGHVGTIVNIGGLNTAQVLWDNGQQCVCKIGENGHHDLKIFDTGPVGVRHIKHYVCSSCSERAIFGMRWQCKHCSDVNLCPVCYVTDKHDINHPFLRFDTPQSHGVEIPKRSASVKCQAMGIFPGATVKKGRDWKWGSQDGGDGKTGEVVSITNNEELSSVRNVVNVKWSSTGLTHNYRLGGIGKVDLVFVEQSQGPFYYRDHLPDCEKRNRI